LTVKSGYNDRKFFHFLILAKINWKFEVISCLEKISIVKKYITIARIIINASVRKLKITKGLTKYINNPITTEEINGKIEIKGLKEIYFLTIKTTATTDNEIIAEAMATPLNPKEKIRIGVRIQVAAVQKIIRYNVFLIWPIAFKAFVKGVEIEDKAALILKKESDSKAGSHFP